MSDFEITVAFGEKAGLKPSVFVGKVISANDNGWFEEFYPLENYNDCMPIAEKFGLSTYQLEDYPNTWFAGKALVTDCYNTLFPNHISEQPTIQRAIVYCFLMMEF